MLNPSCAVFLQVTKKSKPKKPLKLIIESKQR